MTQSVEDKDDGNDDCSESNGEESAMEASERQSKTSDQKECSIDRFIDHEQVRMFLFFPQFSTKV